MANSHSEPSDYAKCREEAERLSTRESCIHLKESALDGTIQQNEYRCQNFAHRVAAYVNDFPKRGFPERLTQASFFSFEERGEEDKKIRSRLLAYCQGMIPAVRVSEHSYEMTGLKMGSFAMYGPPGTGKTFAAVCVAKEAIWMGHRSHYITVSSLAREVRSTFRKGSDDSEESILEKYSGTPLLILDEIGAGTGSDHERAMFTDVISERYNAKRPTILISNLDLKDFKEALGERVTDRMSEDGGFILPVLGASRRRE